MRYLLLDSYVLLSIVNTKLRDFYSSLNDLCADMGINQIKLEENLPESDTDTLKRRINSSASFKGKYVLTFGMIPNII